LVRDVFHCYLQVLIDGHHTDAAARLNTFRFITVFAPATLIVSHRRLSMIMAAFLLAGTHVDVVNSAVIGGQCSLFRLFGCRDNNQYDTRSQHRAHVAD